MRENESLIYEFVLKGNICSKMNNFRLSNILSHKSCSYCVSNYVLVSGLGCILVHAR